MRSHTWPLGSGITGAPTIAATANRVVPKLRGSEETAFWIWSIAILIFSIMTIYLIGASFSSDAATNEAEALSDLSRRGSDFVHRARARRRGAAAGSR